MRRSQGLEAGNQCPALEKGLSQGLEARNQCPVLKKYLLQGLEAQNQCPILEKGFLQGLESRNQCPVLKNWPLQGLGVELGRTWQASMQAGHFIDHSAPSPAITGAGDSKQPSRTKPKGFALAALC